MKKNLNQGSAHVVAIICLVAALLCALGVVFYQNFVLKQQSEQKTQVSVSSTKKNSANSVDD
jgi:capsular polysaccharide biosynthesis protein